MGVKIGRNDPCPCGSGKKYKKCHLNTDAAVSTSHPFSAFNLPFLIKHLCSLYVLPSNHGKNIRLEQLSREALLYAHRDGGSEDLYSLKKIIEEYYDHNPHEDSPVNLFTEIITFTGGDYLVLPGISEGGTFILSNFLNAIFHTENKIPEVLKALIHDASMLVLGISNELLHSARLKRYEQPIFDTNLIQFPDDSLYNSIENYSFITNTKLEELANKYFTRSSIIDLFSLTVNEDYSNDDPDANPVIGKPFLRTNEGLFIVSPSNLHVSLTHFIVESCIHHNCLDELLKVNSEIIWHNSIAHLNFSNYKEIEDFDFPENPNANFEEKLFRFDLDKIAYVDFYYDTGSNYNIISPYASQFISISNDIDKHLNSVCKKINQIFPHDKILHISLFTGIGRQFSKGHKQIDDVFSVNFSASDFDLIMRTREYNSLMLWNYVNAKEEFLKTTKLTPFTSELDLFSIYKKHDDSFYLNDEAKPSMIFFEPGMSSKFVADTTIKEDFHSIKGLENNRLFFAPSIKTPWSENVYTPLSKIGVELVYIIEGYAQPIWIKFKGDIHSIAPNKRRVYVEFLEAIAYWIWQITLTAKQHLDLVLDCPINLYYDFIDREKFETISLDLTRQEGLEDDFKLIHTDNSIDILIPEKINPYLYGADNIGERTLLKIILLGFRHLQETKNGNVTLTDEIINSIIENHAPIGVKKKIYLINTQNDLRLDPRGLPKTKYIKEYNINKLLDTHVPNLVKAGIISGNAEEITDKTKFIRNFVGKVLLTQLIELLKPINTNKLLRYFISLNEKLIQKRKLTFLNTPTRIACFVTTDEQIKTVYDSLNEIDKTALSVRCLIEHIAASPSSGTRDSSNSEIDEMLALMDQIISWGMLGDQINYDLFDIKIDILPSKRIGSDKIISKQVFEPFRMAKAKEDVVDAINDFESKFIEKEVNSQNKIPENLDQAFNDEFGVTLTRMLEFCHVLTHIGFEIDPGCCILSKDELEVEIKKYLDNITTDEFNALLKYFTLVERGDVKKVPEGYMPYDISPWRYNRGLSLLRKPIIEVFDKVKNIKYYYWGSRQVIVTANQILYLFYSGKLRAKEGGKLISLIGDQLNKKGSKFTNEIYQYIKDNCAPDVLDKEVLINPNSLLKSDTDIGDVDVFIIDSKMKVVILVECKKTEVAKNIKQIVEEVDNLFGSESKMGWIDKHNRRFEWVKNNIHLIEGKYQIKLTDYKIIPVVLTSEDLSTKYLKKDLLPFKMVTYYELKEYKLNSFI